MHVSWKSRSIRVFQLNDVDDKEEISPSKVRSIDLSENLLTEVSGLLQFSTLLSLDVSGNNISELRGLPITLVRLRAARNSLIHITGLEALVRIEELDLSHNRLVDMSGLARNSRLRVLKLSDNRISRIECIEHLRLLECLDLEDNEIEHTEDLRSLSLLTNLKILRMQGNSVSRLPAYKVTCQNLLPHLIRFDGQKTLRYSFKSTGNDSSSKSKRRPSTPKRTPRSSGGSTTSGAWIDSLRESNSSRKENTKNGDERDVVANDSSSSMAWTLSSIHQRSEYRRSELEVENSKLHNKMKELQERIGQMKKQINHCEKERVKFVKQCSEKDVHVIELGRQLEESSEKNQDLQKKIQDVKRKRKADAARLRERLNIERQDKEEMDISRRDFEVELSFAREELEGERIARRQLSGEVDRLHGEMKSMQTSIDKMGEYVTRKSVAAESHHDTVSIENEKTEENAHVSSINASMKSPMEKSSSFSSRKKKSVVLRGSPVKEGRNFNDIQHLAGPSRNFSQFAWESSLRGSASRCSRSSPRKNAQESYLNIDDSEGRSFSRQLDRDSEEMLEKIHEENEMLARKIRELVEKIEEDSSPEEREQLSLPVPSSLDGGCQDRAALLDRIISSRGGSSLTPKARESVEFAVKLKKWLQLELERTQDLFRVREACAMGRESGLAEKVDREIERMERVEEDEDLQNISVVHDEKLQEEEEDKRSSDLEVSPISLQQEPVNRSSEEIGESPDATRREKLSEEKMSEMLSTGDVKGLAAVLSSLSAEGVASALVLSAQKIARSPAVFKDSEGNPTQLVSRLNVVKDDDLGYPYRERSVKEEYRAKLQEARRERGLS